MNPPFTRVLVANRGEIAIRIIRAAHELGMEAVAVYSDADAGAAHVRAADGAVHVGPSPATESYLQVDRIVRAAVDVGAEAIHPGFGFLSERATFARAVEDAGVVFVGPASATIERLGDKLAARRAAKDAGVPVVPGTLEPAILDAASVGDLLRTAEEIGFPLLIKAAAGGGGRGMRRVEQPRDLPAALGTASAEARSAFGDGSVYLEREVLPARHVEVQLLGDAAGTVVALGERDCSIQRRHQKLVEEAPAPGLAARDRRAVHDMAVGVARSVGLRNAATAEFLLDPGGQFYFLEVNTRLQVEHGVTELITGVDIVREQFLLAAGRPLSGAAIAASEHAASPVGHAIEVRVAAEDPSRDFAPTPGTIRHWVVPSGPGVRVDAGVEAGDRVPPEYDNLIAKILVHASDRDAAIDRLRRALDDTEVAGIQTTLPFHRFVARSDAFRAGDLSTGWVADHWDGASELRRVAQAAQMVAALAAVQGRTGRSLDDRRNGSGLGRPGEERWAEAALETAVDRWPR